MQVGPFQVTYCTNVHPGQTLDELFQVLEYDVPAVKKQLTTGTFGTGLRIGHPVVNEINQDPDSLIRLIELCHEHQYDVFTVNGFPYGNFDEGVVKESVYQPDWRTNERLQYTIELAKVLAALPGPTHRTISTVAGGFGPDTQSEDDRRLMAKNMTAAATALARLEDETGIRIRLCLEPEPWTTLETTSDVLSFWSKYLERSRVNQSHLGLCYDCCHQALHFEDVHSSIEAIEAHGITIGKIQVSSALHLDKPQDLAARNKLLDFAEGRFLHQVIAKTDDGLLKCLDLPALRTPSQDWLNAEAWRCHFHIPIWWRGSELIQTTHEDWRAAVGAAHRLESPPHLEIETYTWDVIPDSERLAMAGGNLSASIVAEYTSLIDELDRGN
ncbi:MAG: metabolite traffic protein EboE [Myxococcota bacterium]|nr:metabolite traffic protein EboE [Myxococcota bacterium]